MMKKLFFILFALATLNIFAQTQTITIDWGFNSTPTASGDANASRTIEVGDTVIWDWYSSNSHNVVRNGGSSTDSFNSGAVTPPGSTFSHTFTSLGTNDYICTPHASIMFGTITVVSEGTLSTPQFENAAEFSIYPNPGKNEMNITLPSVINEGLKLEIFDVLGKKVYVETLSTLNSKVNITKWNSGLYLVRLSTPDKDITLTKRFVKL